MENFNFKIETQPKQNFHFRYASELRNTHGVIVGQPTISKQYIEDTGIRPKIKMHLPHGAQLDDCGNKRDFYVLCSLHSYSDGQPQTLSPHLLMKRGQIQVQYNFVFEKMSENKQDDLERYWMLKDYVIVRLKNEQYRNSLKEKHIKYEHLKLPLAFEVLCGDLNIEDNASLKRSGVLNVCLGFTIFEHDFYENTYRLYKETIYSNNIFHGDDLRIYRLCNSKGPLDGDTDVTVLIKLQPGYEYNVRMFRHDNVSHHVNWEKIIKLGNENIFSNAAITFTLPKGPAEESPDEIEVMLEVMVGLSTYKSNFTKFVYLNTVDDEVRRKRARKETAAESDNISLNSVQNAVVSTTSAMDQHELTQFREAVSKPSIIDALLRNDMSYFVTMPVINVVQNHVIPTEVSDLPTISETSYLDEQLWNEYISYDSCSTVIENEGKIEQKARCTLNDKQLNIEKKITAILNMPENYHTINIKGLYSGNGNSIFHEAILNENNLHTLHRLMKTTKHKKLVLKARNNLGQNLLHFACIQNKSNCIRPLVGMGCALHEQERQGRTPLHISIERNDNKCILEFQELLNDGYKKYPKEVATQLMQMLGAYNNRGHTVLHAAVLEKHCKLVEILLKFCESHQIDITEHEVLGSGDSIVHLMVRNNLLDMIELIKRYIPNYLSIENYAGSKISDIPDITCEMFDALGIKANLD